MKQRLLPIAGIGLIVLGMSLLYLRQSAAQSPINPKSATIFSSKNGNTGVKQATVLEGNPSQLEIPSLAIKLPVIKGYYNKTSKSWTLTNDKAQFATITPEPNNQSGNTFIYGHYRKGVFSNLHKIQPGALIKITSDNHHTFTYKFVESYETSPNDDTLFQYKGSPILTIQTCSGLWFQNRQLFRFDFVEAS